MTADRRWRKSSRSATETNCVEVAHDLAAVRDSKNHSGPTLAVDAVSLLTWARTTPRGGRT